MIMFTSTTRTALGLVDQSHTCRDGLFIISHCLVTYVKCDTRMHHRVHGEWYAHFKTPLASRVRPYWWLVAIEYPTPCLVACVANISANQRVTFNG